MNKHKSSQVIGQLEKRKGGYSFLRIDKEIVDQFEQKRNTRLICKLDNKLSFHCGLNHLGDGNFFIILSARNLKLLGKNIGDSVAFEISIDPNPLGMEVPEIIQILLEQDAELKDKFNGLRDGKKRSILVQTSKIKDIDKQVAKAVELINNPNAQGRKS